MGYLTPSRFKCEAVANCRLELPSIRKVFALRCHEEPTEILAVDWRVDIQPVIRLVCVGLDYVALRIGVDSSKVHLSTHTTEVLTLHSEEAIMCIYD